VRQWVLSFPRRVRFLAARRPALASRLLDLFTRAVFAWQRRCTRRLGAADPRTGGVTAVQRFGSALNLNVHFHTLLPDGVFLLDGDGPARFVPLPPPRDADLAAILERVVRRTARALVGYEDLESEADALAALQAAEVDRRQRFPDQFRHSRYGAFLDGFSLHAGVRIHENDREGRERLCRYALRPPMTPRQLPALAAPNARLLTAAAFQGLAEVPPELEWFANVQNGQTARKIAKLHASEHRCGGVLPLKIRTLKHVPKRVVTRPLAKTHTCAITGPPSLPSLIEARALSP
jgi:hypothetical protein